MDFEKAVCPVCKKNFTAEDDVVVCPECGTPHHRACYRENGACANASLHKEGFVYREEPSSPAKDNPAFAESLPGEEREQSRSAGAAPLFPEEPGQGTGQGTGQNPEQNPMADLFRDLQGKSTDEYLIGGVKASLFETAIGKNAGYYVPRFLVMDRAKKNVLWNFFAFLCPLAWALYRKMYALAAILLGALLVLSVSSEMVYLTNTEYMTAMTECMQEDPAFYTKILSFQGGGEVQLSQKQVHLLEVLNSIEYPAVLSYGLWIAELSICTVTGLFGTKWYRDALLKKIRRAQTLYPGESDKKLYLARKGGTFPVIIVAVIAFFEVASYL